MTHDFERAKHLARLAAGERDNDVYLTMAACRLRMAMSARQRLAWRTAR